jgi:sugar/nucleoside kinase (ribokinase family)
MDPDAALAGVDCVHIMGSSAFSVAAVEAIEEVYVAAVARGVRVSFDPNIRPEMLTRPEYVEALHRILGGARLVLASEWELQALLGDGTDAECAAQLMAGSAEAVVVKRGAKGASLFLPGHDEVRVPGLAVDEVDPTGAGDCFGGTFLSLYLAGIDAPEALRFANVAGAMAVTERGPMSGNRSLEALRAAERSLVPA